MQGPTTSGPEKRPSEGKSSFQEEKKNRAPGLDAVHPSYTAQRRWAGQAADGPADNPLGNYVAMADQSTRVTQLKAYLDRAKPAPAPIEYPPPLPIFWVSTVEFVSE